MPMNNNLNVSELLKRLGVVGDSQGSAALLDQIRMGVQIADLSDLVPPVGVPIAGARGDSLGGVNQFSRWSLQSMSPGGLTVLALTLDNIAEGLNIFVTSGTPIADPRVVSANNDFVFGQTAQSIFTTWDSVTSTFSPTLSLRLFGNGSADYDHIMPRGMWVGPGQFFNIEAVQTNRVQSVNITWREYPAALNP